MNILYYHQYFSTPAGATGTRSYEFARALIKRGHNVSIICLNNDRSVTGLEEKGFIKGVRNGLVDKINIFEININYSNNLNLIKRSLIFLKFTLKSILLGFEVNTDLVICTSTPLTISIPGLILKFCKNIPLVFEVRDLWPELPVAMKLIKNKLIIFLLEILEKVSYKFSDAIIGLSPGICSGILKRSNNKLIFQIPNACDLGLFKYSSIEKKFPVRYLDINANKRNKVLIAAFAGAHGKANGLDAILYAAKKVINLGRKDIHFIFIGDGSEKKSLIEIANKEEIVNCHFLDPLPKSELSNFFRNYVDIGLMVLQDIPAFYNGTSPNKFFDYISSGLPVLINYPGWLSDLVLKYNIGIFVKPNDPISFAKSLIKFLDSPNNNKIMGKNARNLAKNKFSREKLSKSFTNVIEDTYKSFYEKK